MAELWLGGGVSKVGVRGWSRGCRLGEFRVGRVGIRGLRSGELKSGGCSQDWGRQSCGWGVGSEELGSRLELGGSGALGSGGLK